MILEDSLIEGDEDFGLMAQPDISECLAGLIRDVNGSDIVEPSLVDRCLVDLALPE
jgi:hypothetical protein